MTKREAVREEGGACDLKSRKNAGGKGESKVRPKKQRKEKKSQPARKRRGRESKI